MNYYYSLSKNKINIEDCGDIQTYGITAKSRCSDEILSEMPDVSTDKSLVIYIIELLNSNSVELCHFYDVVIDQLNQQ